MAINFYFEDVEPIRLPSLRYKKWIKSVISNHTKKIGDISFIFCSDSYLLNINQQFLQHDYFTDVITFDYCEANLVSGDIFISLDRISDNANSLNQTYDIELQRIIIHGILHLLSYDDKSPELKEGMTRAENLALELLHTVK